MPCCMETNGSESLIPYIYMVGRTNNIISTVSQEELYRRYGVNGISDIKLFNISYIDNEIIEIIIRLNN